MSQKVYVELTDRDHQVYIHVTSTAEEMLKAVAIVQPDIILAPFLKTAIPEVIWKYNKCIIFHPGIKGDRGPSSLDWAILNDESEWGVTLLQADSEMDAGDIWFSENFPMRNASKSALYRHEVADTFIKGLHILFDQLESFEKGEFSPEKLDYSDPNVKGQLMPTMKQVDRKINWSTDKSDEIIRKIRSADSNPGVLDEIFGEPYYLYGAHEEEEHFGESGKILGYRDDAVLVGTIDGSVWISHVKKKDRGIKLPATIALKEMLKNVKELTLSPFENYSGKTYREIYYYEKNYVGYLHFDFYNGAMSTRHCQSLLEALRIAKKRDTKVLVLMGGHDFWSNGIHLNTIENAKDSAFESWLNINAMNDVVLEIIETSDKQTISAIQGNAGAGGVILALAADYVYAKKGVILNPHYKKMGNLYGSEYWTYLLPKRVGKEIARKLTDECKPIGVVKSEEIGLIDSFFDTDKSSFVEKITETAEELAQTEDFNFQIKIKKHVLEKNDQVKPLEVYRHEELGQMGINFYGDDRSYHISRSNFVRKVSCGKGELILGQELLPILK